MVSLLPFGLEFDRRYSPFMLATLRLPEYAVLGNAKP